MGFSKAVLERFEKEREVDVETRSAKGTKHSVTIWIVVVDGTPYVRSYLGPRGRWYRELLARREGAIVADGRRTRVRATHDRSAKAIAAVSAALRRKYSRSGQSLKSMLRDDVLDTTVRLEPAAPA